ncbi:MAG: hypothetical protein IPL27_19235 [Lewinellaceae bacterium]|nr:hypothetical protein [Lewinellaceae bacterium]
MADFLDEELMNKMAARNRGTIFPGKRIRKGSQGISTGRSINWRNQKRVLSYKRYEEQYIPFMLAALALSSSGTPDVYPVPEIPLICLSNLAPA